MCCYEEKISNNEHEVPETKSFENTNNHIVKNIAVVALSNIFTLLSGVLVGFVIPKIMGVTDYAYYKIFTLYLSYVGLFHFGFCDGIYLLYGGKSYESYDKNKFRRYTRFLLYFQMIITLIVTIIGVILINNEYGFTIIFLGVSLLAQNITAYYQIISQISGRFKELSRRNIIKALLTCISVVVLFILCKFSILDYLHYKIFVAISTLISIFMAIWYIFTYREITFGKANSFSKEKDNIHLFFKVGIVLLVANLVSNLILSIDRQFVSILFEKEEYGVYAFAYNMLGLVTTVIGAISTVLYPTLKRYNEDRLKSNYKRLIAIISILVSICMSCYYPLKFIIEYWLIDYCNSLPIFRVILPGLLLSSCISMIIFNYFKSISKYKLFFIVSIFVLIMSIILNIIAYYIFQTTISISIASVIVTLIWFLITDIYLCHRFKLLNIRNYIYISLIIVGFYIITFLISNPFVGFGVYILFDLLISLIFHFKLIFNKFRELGE